MEQARQTNQTWSLTSLTVEWGDGTDAGSLVWNRFEYGFYLGLAFSVLLLLLKPEGMAFGLLLKGRFSVEPSLKALRPFTLDLFVIQRRTRFRLQ
jgi:hypothetical protein